MSLRPKKSKSKLIRKYTEVVYESSILPKGWKYHPREFRRVEPAKREQERLEKKGFDTKRIRGKKSQIAIAIKPKGEKSVVSETRIEIDWNRVATKYQIQIRKAKTHDEIDAIVKRAKNLGVPKKQLTDIERTAISQGQDIPTDFEKKAEEKRKKDRKKIQWPPDMQEFDTEHGPRIFTLQGYAFPSKKETQPTIKRSKKDGLVTKVIFHEGYWHVYYAKKLDKREIRALETQPKLSREKEAIAARVSKAQHDEIAGKKRLDEAYAESRRKRRLQAEKDKEYLKKKE